jgi:hypothetical protein
MPCHYLDLDARELREPEPEPEHFDYGDGPGDW